MRTRIFLIIMVIAASVVSLAFLAMISAYQKTGQTAGLARMPDFQTAGLGAGDLAGKTVMLNFFASWCTPCRAEIPEFLELTRNYNITIYGIAYKDTPEDTARFLKDVGNPYGKIGHDENGDVAESWGLIGVPETYLIAPDGKILYRISGPLTRQRIESDLAPYLSKL